MGEAPQPEKSGDLLELFQWGEYKDEDVHEKIKAELTDIMIYCLYLAESNNIDTTEAVVKKLDKAAKKYPIEVFNAAKDDPADYWRIKKAHRGK